MINELKKESKNNYNHFHKKNTVQNLFNSNSNSFIQIFVNETKKLDYSKKIDQSKQINILNDDNNESYLFKPEINQKSKDLFNKKLQKSKNSSFLINSDFRNNSYIENRRFNTSIGESLYEDAFNKMQKLENICNNEKINIEKECNKSLISKGSEQLLFKKNELKIKEVVEKYSKNNDKRISIINIIQCLYEMNVLRELLKYRNKSIEEINLENIKALIEEIINQKNINTKDLLEVEFVEQLWIIVNPNYENENDYVEKEIIYSFFKILFSLNQQTEINKMIITIQNHLKSMNKKEIKDNSGNKEKIKNEKIDNEKINNENQVEQIKENKKINNEKNNNKKNKKYFSLLRKKEFEKDEIWPISKFVRVFFELKKLSGNYQNSKKEKIMENIIKER